MSDSLHHTSSLIVYYIMAYLPIIIIVLMYYFVPGSPFGWGLFDYDDDDTNVNATLAANATNITSTGPFSCQTFQPVFDYLNDAFNFFDENFNPWYEPPEMPLNITTTPAPNQG